MLYNAEISSRVDAFVFIFTTTMNGSTLIFSRNRKQFVLYKQTVFFAPFTQYCLIYEMSA